MKQVRFFPSCRFGLVSLSFYGALCFYLIRVNFGVSIVCMTVDPAKNDTMVSHMTSTNDTVGDEFGQCAELRRSDKQIGVFVWDRRLRGLLNSAFYIGYVVSHIPGGYLAQHYGPKLVHLVGLGIATIASLLSPVSATASPWLLFTVRIILGLGCGVFVPAVRAILSNWSPTYERSIIYTLHASGYSVGTVLAFYLSGALCDTLGWQSTFYVPALFMCGYIILFAFFGSNSPDERAKCLSETEKNFITDKRTQQIEFTGRIPWRSIFTSVPCCFLFLSEFCSSWGGYTMIICGAQYMKDILRFDIRANGMYSALPQLIKFIMSILAGIFIDYIRRKQILSTTNSRKLAQTFGMLIPAAMMLSLVYLDCNTRVVAVALLCVGQGFDGFIRAGIAVNIMEVAPRYVAILGGIMNTFSTAAGMICPIVVGILTPNGADAEWHTVFYLGTGMYVFGWFLYVIFTNAEVQPWARSLNSKEEETSNITQTETM